MISALFAPVYAFWLFGVAPLVPAIGVIALLLVWRHRANIRKLFAGEEGRIGEKKSPGAA